MTARSQPTATTRIVQSISSPAGLPAAAAVLSAWAALWVATALGALAAPAGVDSLRTPQPRDTLDTSLATAVDLLVHNAAVALWPLALVALSWPTLPGARRIGDGLVVAHLLVHGAVVGGAIGSHPATWRYLPHLPAEWLALGIPAGLWLAARTGTPIGRRQAATAAAVTVTALAAAAVTETYAVPL